MVIGVILNRNVKFAACGRPCCKTVTIVIAVAAAIDLVGKVAIGLTVDEHKAFVALGFGIEPQGGVCQVFRHGIFAFEPAEGAFFAAPGGADLAGGVEAFVLRSCI